MTNVHSNSVLLDTKVHALNLYDQDISCDGRYRKKNEYERSCEGRWIGDIECVCMLPRMSLSFEALIMVGGLL